MTLVYCFDGTLKTCFRAGGSDSSLLAQHAGEPWFIPVCSACMRAGAHSIHPNTGKWRREKEVQGHSWLDSSAGVSETLLQ